MTDDVRKLLGGYATGTLTDDEKQILFDAALTDDALFKALADEHALKELLDDPAVRAQLLQAAGTPVFSVTALLREWLERPRSKALVATGIVLLVAITMTTMRDQRKMQVARREPVGAPALAPYVPRPEEPPAATQESRAVKPRAAARAPQAKQETLIAADSAREAEAQVGAQTLQRHDSAPAAAAASFRDEQNTSADARLKYSLVRRSASGGYTAVPLDTELAPDEEVRLTVEVTEHGTVAVLRSDSSSVTSVAVEPGRPATFTLPATTRSATLSFSPASGRLVGNTLIPALRSQSRATQVPAAAAEAGAQKQADSRSPVVVEIKLNRK